MNKWILSSFHPQQAKSLPLFSRLFFDFFSVCLMNFSLSASSHISYHFVRPPLSSVILCPYWKKRLLKVIYLRIGSFLPHKISTSFLRHHTHHTIFTQDQKFFSLSIIHMDTQSPQTHNQRTTEFWYFCLYLMFIFAHFCLFLSYVVVRILNISNTSAILYCILYAYVHVLLYKYIQVLVSTTTVYYRL